MTSEPAAWKLRGHRNDVSRVHSPAVADFLHRALAGGTLSVAELEAKARTAGLLGERQSIQHAKAFKKAKKALGIRSIRDGFGSGGKWAWPMPPHLDVYGKHFYKTAKGILQGRFALSAQPAI